MNTIEYFVEYQEAGSFDDWIRKPTAFPSFIDAMAQVVKWQEEFNTQYGPKHYRIAQEVHKQIILWSTEDGDE